MAERITEDWLHDYVVESEHAADSLTRRKVRYGRKLLSDAEALSREVLRLRALIATVNSDAHGAWCDDIALAAEARAIRADKKLGRYYCSEECPGCALIAP